MLYQLYEQQMTTTPTAFHSGFGKLCGIYWVLCERCDEIDQQIVLEKIRKTPYVKLVAILEIEGATGS